jgi:SAM-dependent methyltransferase
VIGGARSIAKAAIGHGVDILLPTLVDTRTGSASNVRLRLKRWVLQSRLERARLAGDTAAVEAALRQFWQGETGDDFYDRYRLRFDRWFNGPHHVLIDQLAASSAQRPWQHLVEIGCGDGRALSHLADVLPGIVDATGIDINPHIIARNSALYAQDPRLRFLEGDATRLLPGLIRADTLLFSYGGVMEYFTPQHLAAIFDLIAATPGAAVALVEPVDPAHDLDQDPQSHVFGAEDSFSHNHRALALAAGLRVDYCQEIRAGGVRWMMLEALGLR